MSSAPYYRDEQVTLLLGDALEVLRTLPDGAVDCIVTSPPYYGLRSYGVDGQYGLEPTPAAYVETMLAVFAEARRVLADDGTLWLNLGDSYSAGGQGAHGGSLGGGAPAHVTRATRTQGVPPKNLLGIPWRTAFALQDDGWILRNEIVWSKPNAMPESVTDRLSSRHEHLFLLAKQSRYWFDLDAIRAPLSDWSQQALRSDWRRKTTAKTDASRKDAVALNGSGKAYSDTVNPNGRNPGDVWEMATRPNSAAHFATFPIDLPLRCIKAGCKPVGTVLDMFSGSGTTGAAARQLGRKYLGIDLNPAYHDLAKARFAQGVLDLPA